MMLKPMRMDCVPTVELLWIVLLRHGQDSKKIFFVQFSFFFSSTLAMCCPAYTTFFDLFIGKTFKTEGYKYFIRLQ